MSVFTIRRNGRLYVRLKYKDSLGRNRELMRRVFDEADAERVKSELTGTSTPIVGFEDFARQYEETRLIPPVYHQSRKIAGLRGWLQARQHLRPLIQFFSSAQLGAITVSDLESYRLQRLKTPKQRGGEMSIATVNRELSLLRAMFNFAVQTGFLNTSPFQRAKGLISLADEEPRDRVLSDEEESLDQRKSLLPFHIASIKNLTFRASESPRFELIARSEQVSFLTVISTFATIGAKGWR
jgi:hypothetical protein